MHQCRVARYNTPETLGISTGVRRSCNGGFGDPLDRHCNTSHLPGRTVAVVVSWYIP